MGKKAQPHVRLAWSRTDLRADLRPDLKPSSLSVESPVSRQSLRKFSADGFALPFNQAQTVGCETSSRSARSTCDVLVSLSHARNASMQHKIVESYSESIARDYSPVRQTDAMVKPKRTVWARVAEVLVENKEPAQQKYFAKAIGITQPSVNAWNKPGQYPSMDIAVQAADYLGVCVQWLLTEAGPKRQLPSNDTHLETFLTAWVKIRDTDKVDLIGAARIRADLANQPEAAPAAAPAAPATRRRRTG